MQAPGSAMDAGIISFRDLIDFISHVADCYPTLVIQFPEDLIRLLNLHHEHLESELREKIVGSLVLLRRKDIIDSPRFVYRNSGKKTWLITQALDYCRHSFLSLYPHIANHCELSSTGNVFQTYAPRTPKAQITA